MQCSKCGKSVPHTSKSCGWCSNPLTQMAQTQGTVNCNKCGKAARAGAEFCSGCGSRFNQTEQSAQPTQAAPEQNTGTVATPTSNRFINLFASPSEKFICAIGTGYLENMIASGSLTTGHAILSDKRIYFAGTTFFRTDNKISKMREERIIDVAEVSSAGFIHYTPFWHLIGAAVFVILLFATLGAGNPRGGIWQEIVYELGGFMSIFFIGGLVVNLAMFFIKRRSLFEISFAGGSAALDMKMLNMNEIKTFQRNLCLMKDAFNDNTEVRQAAMVGKAVNAANE